MDTNQKTRTPERKRPQQSEEQKRSPAKTARRTAPSGTQKKGTSSVKASGASRKQPAYDASESLTAGRTRTSVKKKQARNKAAQKQALSRSEQTKLRQERRAEEALKKEKREKKTPAPAVVYTQPLPFNSNRLLIQLLTITAVVVALVLGLSVFFKVKTVTVVGADVYSPWAVREASGINEGDNLLTFSRAKANAQIQAKLPYVEKSRIGIKLPDTVTIYIEELQVSYAIAAEDGIWWLMNSDGRLVEQVDTTTAKKHTRVLGVTVTGPVVNEFAVATEAVPSETDALGEVIPVTVTGAQRLNAAMQILDALEANDIVGEAASVDVSSMSAIELWYGTKYQVNLGDSSNMDKKIASMYAAILSLSNYQTGRLDCSFTVMPNDVMYTAFE